MSHVPMRRDLAWIAATVGATLIGSLVPLVTNNRFYYYDDTQAGAFGIWFEIGTKISSGEWPLFSDSAWGAGNYAAEGQWGIWNPLILLIGLIASKSANIVVFSTILKISFLCVMAAGTFLVARSYKASPEWAAIAGVAVTLTGFTVYMDAASWVTGLMVFSLLPLAWFGLHRMAFARANPILALATSYVLITIGYVHGTLMLAILFLGLLTEAWVRASRRAALRLLLTGLVCGTVALAVYLPGVLTAPVTARTGGIVNSGFLTPDLTGLATAWVPGSLPQVTGWWGGFAPVPLLYVAWFLPALVLVDYGRARGGIKDFAAIGVFGLLSLGLTLAPSDLGPLRFPVRLMPYVSLAVLIATAVLVSRYRVAALSRARLAITAAIVVSGLYLAWTQFPSFRLAASFGLLSVAGIAVLYFFLYSGRVRGRFRTPALTAAVPILISLVIAGGQHAAFKGSPLPDYRMPDASAGYTQQLPGAKGGTFVVGDPTILGAGIWDETLASNAWYLNAAEVQNLYSPIMFAEYAEDLCISSHGWTCAAAGRKLFETDETTGAVLADLLSLDTVQILRDPQPQANDAFRDTPPAGWHETTRSENSVVWVRNMPRLNTGQVVWASAGADLRVVSESSQEVVIRVNRLDHGAGNAVLSRLAWPGYTAEGASLAAPLRGYLVGLDIPAGSEGKDIVLRFSPPGWPVVIGSIIFAVVVTVAWSVAEALAVRRRPRKWSGATLPAAISP
ncbi:hypothetical protein [Arthrobacter sp. BE255]|uniref:hypothetical protein n=1 Tax=Arthrobacter sp. BE255 TaxID=2817721 RepID=UPI00285F41C1|nr:hypothetical protein [Arthrobacter sp. BE255]MDR7157741.1 hypothetical protein [Arthrobacter sp. BE255]